MCVGQLGRMGCASVFMSSSPSKASDGKKKKERVESNVYHQKMEVRIVFGIEAVRRSSGTGGSACAKLPYDATTDCATWLTNL